MIFKKKEKNKEVLWHFNYKMRPYKKNCMRKSEKRHISLYLTKDEYQGIKKLIGAIIKEEDETNKLLDIYSVLVNGLSMYPLFGNEQEGSDES